MSSNELAQEETVDGIATDSNIVLAPEDGEVTIHNSKILQLPVRMVVSVGRAELTVQEILDLTPTSVIDLDSKIDDVADIYVGEKLIARGELVELEDAVSGLGIRLTEVCGKSD